ncbi:MAG: DUF853 domain-containing protein [Lachnospiraceae bacterium]|nr:DUF853 domain-containing protein [Lachnospiraceae bacterium]
MVKDGKILVGKTAEGKEIFLLPGMANRHGLIAGATGTGKTVSLKVLAEGFSDLGVPVFLSDVKGDLSGMAFEGEENENVTARVEKFSLKECGFSLRSYPAEYYDIFQKNGMPLRTTISEMGPLLLSRIFELNQTQADILSVAFRIADEENLLLVDTKDLRAMLNYLADNAKDYSEEYGNISKASIGVILRALSSLETKGGEQFFGETALNIRDWLSSRDGKGVINILDCQELVSDGTLYSTFLLWMLSELYETLPEVGDMSRPKIVFFFDEAHLLFKNASKTLMDKITQIVRLVRSKGVGIYFVTQSPADIPDDVLSQLGNKIQHALRAYTPADRKAVRAAAQSYRENPSFDTEAAIEELATGEAVVSMLDDTGTPSIVERAMILPPQSRMGSITDSERDRLIKESLLYSKYEKAEDPDSAYEFLQRVGLEAEEKAREEAEAKEAEKEELAAQKAREKEEAAAQKAKEKEEKKASNARKRAAKSVGNSIAGTVGREAGKTFGSAFGSFGKTLGGNVGASLGRGIIGTLFKM